jgi:hypothetical protein
MGAGTGDPDKCHNLITSCDFIIQLFTPITPVSARLDERHAPD